MTENQPYTDSIQKKKLSLKEYNRQYYLKNKETINSKYRLKYKTDEKFREHKKTVSKNRYVSKQKK
jgi:hypothetical protein